MLFIFHQILDTFQGKSKKHIKVKKKQLETFIGCGKVRESSIKSDSCEKKPGVEIHSKLKFDKHIKTVCNKK